MDTVSVKFSPRFSLTKKMSDSFVIYSSSDYENLPLELKKTSAHGKVLVKTLGRNLPRLSDWTIRLYGRWKKSEQYGYSFICEHYHLVSPSSLKGIVRFLASKTFNGIGLKTAKAIVEEFGEDTLSIIELTPEELLKIKGVTYDKMQMISRCYLKNISFSKLASYLGEFGLSNDRISKIHDIYPEIDTVAKNPYLLMNIKGVGFYTCEKIAVAEGVALDSKDRIKACVKQILHDEAESSGGTFMIYADAETKAMKMLNFDGEHVSLDLLRKTLVELRDENSIVFRSKHIMLKDYDEAESYIAEKIAMFNENKCQFTTEIVSKKVDEFMDSSLKLSSQQKNAVITALSNRVSVITGGAGTGKTTILKAIISVYECLNPSGVVTMLAPTGKASRRMSEAVSLNAQTIHSKLKIYEDGQDDEVIEPGIAIVDEGSMVDTIVMYKLLRAMDASKTQLVLIGDVNQLPSVGAGSVLNDLIESETIAVTRLSETFRQTSGSLIIENANKVINGDTNLKYGQDFCLIRVKNEEEGRKVTKDLFKDSINEFGIEQTALLTPRKEGKGKYLCVADEMNGVIQDELIPTSSKSAVFSGKEYRIGDRIMQCKNTQYTSNGDIGTITDITQEDDGVVVSVFWENGSSTKETRETMNSISLAYAMSVHKSQGSQYDCVIIPMFSNHVCPIYRSNLLYTAITRAKKKLIIVADSDYAINYCITHKDAQRRNTMLCARLKTVSMAK